MQRSLKDLTKDLDDKKSHLLKNHSYEISYFFRITLCFNRNLQALLLVLKIFHLLIFTATLRIQSKVFCY